MGKTKNTSNETDVQLAAAGTEDVESQALDGEDTVAGAVVDGEGDQQVDSSDNNGNTDSEEGSVSEGSESQSGSESSDDESQETIDPDTKEYGSGSSSSEGTSGSDQTDSSSQDKETEDTKKDPIEESTGEDKTDSETTGKESEKEEEVVVIKPVAPTLETTSLEATPGTALVLRFNLPVNCTLKIDNVDNKGSITIRENIAMYAPHSPTSDETVNFKAYSVTTENVESDALEFQVKVKKSSITETIIDGDSSNYDEEGEATVLNSGVKLPYSELELAVGNEKTITLTAARGDYNFEDVQSVNGIEINDYVGGEITLTQVSQKAFTLKANTATLQPLQLNILVKSQENMFITLQLTVTVNEATSFVDCEFNKDSIDICPGNAVNFTLKGVDAEIVTLESGNVIEDSPVKIDTTKRQITCNEVGSFTQGIVAKKGSISRILYIQVVCKNILSIDTESIAINVLETASVGFSLTGTECTVVVADPSVLEVTKNNASIDIKPLSVGSTKITLTGNRGDLTQSQYVTVEIRDAVYPTRPVCQTTSPVVQGGENIYLEFDIGKKGDTLTARLADSSTGKLVVENNVVTYVAFSPDKDTTIKLYVKTTSVDKLESDEVEVEVKVLGVPDTILTVPTSVTVSEGDTVSLAVSTNATSVSMTSSVPEFLKVNSSKRTVTGVKYGTAIVTITAQAVNCRSVTKDITVIVEPGKVNKPALSSVLRSVTEGKVLALSFIVDADTKLYAREMSGAGTVEVIENVVSWTAPLITEEERQTYTLEVYSKRNIVNTQSDKLIFNVVVLKAKEVTPDEDTGEEDITGKLTYDELHKVLRSEDLTFADKVALVKSRGQGLAVTTLTRLLSYETVMNSSNKTLTAAVGAAKNYELYMSLRTVLELTDNDKFQALFTLVNLVFKEYADDAYSSVKMNRFDREWSGGDRNKYSFQNITTLLTMLCNVLKRASNLNKIDFTVVFDKEKTVFTDRVRESVIKYYTL